MSSNGTTCTNLHSPHIVYCFLKSNALRSVSAVTDPYVEGIANIEWSEQSPFAVVSGYTESVSKPRALTYRS